AHNQDQAARSIELRKAFARRLQLPHAGADGDHGQHCAPHCNGNILPSELQADADWNGGESYSQREQRVGSPLPFPRQHCQPSRRCPCGTRYLGWVRHDVLLSAISAIQAPSLSGTARRSPPTRGITTYVGSRHRRKATTAIGLHKKYELVSG